MKNDNMNDKRSLRIFGKKISSHNFFALILCTIIGIAMTCTTLYRNKKLSTNTDVVVAKIIDINQVHNGIGLWGYEMKYQFYLYDKMYTGTHSIQKKEIDIIHIGDCIEIIVSLDNVKVQKWNKSKGFFNCQ